MVDWIKMRINLAEDPAVIGVASTLGIDEATVVGHLHRLWSWADQQTIDGNAIGVTDVWLDRYIGVTGFVRALVQVGWLIVETSDLDGHPSGVQIPKFDVHNSQSAKQRALTARRVAKSRGKNCNDPDVTKTLPDKRREDKRRKKKKTPLNPPKGKVVVTEDIDAVIGHYQSHHPSARPGAKERKLIAARLKEGYIVEDLCVAIDGCHRSAYHAGQNKDATVYQSLELIVRDSKHIQQFMEVPESGTAVPPVRRSPGRVYK